MTQKLYERQGFDVQSCLISDDPKAQEFNALSFELEHYKDFQKSKNSYVEYEIDSIKEDFGEMFRLWNGKILVGTFYEISDGWKAVPFYLRKQYIRAEIDLSKSVDSSDKAIAYLKSLYEGKSKDSISHQTRLTAA
jgi:hypothetical protein